VAKQWRRSRGVRFPVGRGPALTNTWSWKLPGVLVELLGGSVGSGFKRGIELAGGCSAAAAGTRVPASERFGQGSKSACRL
jgi:hypothetical protein